MENTQLRLKNLENTYGVTIETPINVTLTEQQLIKIEDEIIKAKNYFSSFQNKILPVEVSGMTRAQKSVTWKQYAANLFWLNIAATIDNDSIFNLNSWLTGITVYGYHQLGLAHDFNPGRN
ncbi:MAG: hypothetical protein LUD68_07205 [Rikenellaceae bacterium]|nr:hypothetical protein [Rikenellaceae bacterium]